jgi:FAD/FMN-containing dehydrogenase/Fe-S oxidoreductase
MELGRIEQDLAHELSSRLRGDVHFDAYSRALYNTDASIYQIEPLGVVFPKDTEDVSSVLRLAYKERVAVLPRGAGTSLSGQTVNDAIVIDTSKYMRDIWEINPEERWAWVGPGLVIDDLNRSARAHGLKFAPDPSTINRATIGGAIGNNSCGARSIVYGKTLDHILEIETVLSDGSITGLGPLTPVELGMKLSCPGLESAIHKQAPLIAKRQREEINLRFPRIKRRVSGYNLDELLSDPRDLSRVIVGSEGTLAVITAAKVNLVPLPKATGLAVFHFSSIVQAMEATVALLDADVSAIELVDNRILEAARTNLSLASRMGFVQGDPKAILIVETSGNSIHEAKASLSHAATIAKKVVPDCIITPIEDPKIQASVWEVRRAGLGLLMGVRGDEKPIPFVEDTAVAPEKLPDYVRRFEEIVQSNETTAAYYGHASAGCLHIRPLVNLKKRSGIKRMVRIAEEVADLVLEFGGSLSGEHGDGIVRGTFTEKMFGPTLYQAFRDLKDLFDPRRIMNPGKILDCPPMAENLRISPMYHPTTIKTTLDFSRESGFAAAVEQCNGQGACRKTSDGTMCPSYMVTRDEEHSTRGRANLLRAVLTRLLPAEQFTSERLYKALDLCLECKACKAECPSGVDMAKLKSEFLSHYNRANGVPLRSRLFADIARLNRVGCLFAPFSNWLMLLPPTKWILTRIGIHPKRKLPNFARRTFSKWFQSHRPDVKAGTRGEVILFHDTFTEGNYPEAGIAATQLLEKAGFLVSLAPRACCGRPMISKGMLEDARTNAQHNVDLLYEYITKGIPIIGTEPSCILTLRDEYPDLLAQDEKALAVANNSFLLDEFLADLSRRGELDLQFHARPETLLFHGHCHQKALAGVENSLQLLGLVPRVNVKPLDAGCCGMAGSFGFEREHYDISMQIGERVLFPTIRDNPDATVIISGVSCRQQIEHGVGIKAIHLSEFLAHALVD